MKELSEHILDLAQNCVAAGASLITITLTEDDSARLTISIRDDGRGMSPEMLARAADPFTTTRTTRKVGMGLPLCRMAAEQTGGRLTLDSVLGQGTTVTVVFHLHHLDCPPMGAIAETIALLIQGNPELDVAYRHVTPRGTVELDTKEIRQTLGDEISLSEPAVFSWIRATLSEQEAEIEEER